MWMQAGSSSGPETQLNINPHLTLSISPITINHCSAHRPPRQHQCADCYLSGFPFYSTISKKKLIWTKPEWIHSHSTIHSVCPCRSINYGRTTEAGMINSGTEAVGSWTCLFVYSGPFSSVRMTSTCRTSSEWLIMTFLFLCAAPDFKPISWILPLKFTDFFKDLICNKLCS